MPLLIQLSNEGKIQMRKKKLFFFVHDEDDLKDIKKKIVCVIDDNDKSSFLWWSERYIISFRYLTHSYLYSAAAHTKRSG